MKQDILLIFVLIVAAVSAAPAEPATSPVATNHVLQVALNAGCARFYGLASNSSINNILTKESPFTLFAPTDEAIANFDQNELSRIKAEPTRLFSFLGFHAGFGRVASQAVKNDIRLTSLAGYEIRMNVYKSNGTTAVTASGAGVSKTDLAATNGIVHIVDRVLYPPPRYSLYDTLNYFPEFGLIYALMIRSNLTDLYKSEGPFTFFAPTDLAIERLSPDEIIILVENQDVLDEFLRSHTVRGTFHTAGLIGRTLNTLNNKKVNTRITRGDKGTITGIYVNGASVNMGSQYPVTNGVIHGIDTVMDDPENSFRDMLRTMAKEKIRRV